MDDGFIRSETLKEHIEYNGRVLDCMEKAGTNLKFRKYLFSVTDVELLGHM